MCEKAAEEEFKKIFYYYYCFFGFCAFIFDGTAKEGTGNWGEREGMTCSKGLPLSILVLVCVCDAKRLRIKWVSGRKFGGKNPSQLTTRR